MDLSTTYWVGSAKNATDIVNMYARGGLQERYESVTITYGDNPETYD
jgi:hypothetical protein